MSDSITPDQNYVENGFVYQIRFAGINSNPGQLLIESLATNPLSGDPDVPITYYNKTLTSFGSSVFYDIIPFEMLKTVEN